MIYFRNNPSILFWEAGNAAISAEHMAEMRALKEQWDPNGMRAMGCRSISDDPAYGGVACIEAAEYAGTMLNRHYSDYVRDRMPIIESEYTRDEAPRRVWDDYTPPDFGYKRDSSATWDLNSEQFATISAVPNFMEFWKDRIQGPGRKMYSGCAALCWADSNQHGRQYLTENCRVSGRVDAVRLPKESFHTYKVMQNNNPDIHIVGHWTYPQGTIKTVYVIANHVASVELFINGISFGIRKEPQIPEFCYAYTNVPWQFGVIKAVGYNAAGQCLCETEIHSSGAPAAIRLTVITGPQGLMADGQDIAMVDVEVVDADGRRCPTDQARIDFTLSGPGSFEGGWNSGKQYSVHKRYVDMECGVNRVFIKAARTPGVITLKAEREGLIPASITIASRPVQITDGLTEEMAHTLSPVLQEELPAYGPDHLEFTEEIRSISSYDAPHTAEIVESGNIALNKPAYTDSEQQGCEATCGNDGNPSSKWCAADEKLDHWWMVDLLSTYDIHAVEVHWEQPGCVYQYKVEVSNDGANWMLKIDKTENAGAEQAQPDPITATARYVRITVTGLEAGTRACFYECKVMGDN